MQPMQPPAGAPAGMQGESCSDALSSVLVPERCLLLLSLNKKIVLISLTSVSSGDLMPGITNPALSSDPSIGQVGYKAKQSCRYPCLETGQ